MYTEIACLNSSKPETKQVKTINSDSLIPSLRLLYLLNLLIGPRKKTYFGLQDFY